MQKIRTLVVYLTMASCCSLLVFFAPWVSAYHFSQLTLLFGKSLLTLAVVARIINLLTSREVRQIFKANINTYGTYGAAHMNSGVNSYSTEKQAYQ